MKTKLLLRIAGAILLLFLFIVPYTLININTLEDSIWLKPAIDVARGLVLFRETFSPYGMLVPLLQGLTVKLFGPFLLPLRMEAALCYAVTGVILFFIWSRYMTRMLSLASVMFWLILAPFYDDLLMPWSSIYALVFQSLGFLALVLFAEKRSGKFLFLAGSMILLTFLARQPVGVFLGAAAGIWLLYLLAAGSISFRQFITYACLLAAGFFLAFLPFLAYLAITRSFTDWFIQSFVFAREYAIVIRGISLEQLLKSLFLGRYVKMHQYEVIWLWLSIPLSSFIFIASPLRRIFTGQKTTVLDAKYFLAGAVGIGSWMQYYPMTEPVHFFWAVTPIVGFFLLAVTKLLPQKKYVLTLFIYLLYCLSAEFVLMRVIASYGRFRNVSVTSKTLPFLRGIRISSYEDAKINQFRTALISHLQPNSSFINISDDAMIPLIDPRFYPVGPLYEQWNFFAERLYPGYYRQVNSVILAKHPVIVTRTLPYIANYCSLKNVGYPQPFMGIHIPLEAVMKVSAGDSDLLITPSQDIVITGVTELSRPIHHFSVPDLNKIVLHPVSTTSMPLTVAKGETAIIPLSKIGEQTVIGLQDKEIESCMFSVTNRLFYR